MNADHGHFVDDIYNSVKKELFQKYKDYRKHDAMLIKYQQLQCPPGFRNKPPSCQFSLRMHEHHAERIQALQLKEQELVNKLGTDLWANRLELYRHASDYYHNEWFPFISRDAKEHIRALVVARAPSALPAAVREQLVTTLELAIGRLVDGSHDDNPAAEPSATAAMDTTQEAPPAAPTPTADMFEQLCQRLRSLELQLQRPVPPENGRGSARPHRGRHGSAQPNAATDTNDRQHRSQHQERRESSDSAARSQSSAHPRRRSPSRAAPHGNNGTRDSESRSHHHRRQHRDRDRSQSRGREHGRPRDAPTDRDHRTNGSHDHNQRNRDRERRSRSQPRHDDSHSRRDSSRRR